MLRSEARLPKRLFTLHAENTRHSSTTSSCRELCRALRCAARSVHRRNSGTGIAYVASKSAKADSQSMRLCKAVAGMLTGLMLSVAFASSSCEVRCDLQDSGPSCHAAAESHGAAHDRAMASMPGMNHGAAEDAVQRTPGAAFRSLSRACANPICLPQAAILPGKLSTLEATHWRSYQPQVADQIVMPASDQQRLKPAGSPLSRDSTPVTLRTTLLL